ncbi:MAG: galactokinase, partial [Lachnospiraceae bacterium]|nr:galactokinase [Lachnospiraceae bacterium]
RSQCEEALRRVNEHEKVESWGSIDGAKFEEIRKYINDEVLERRAKHAVYDNERTVKAVAALKANDIKLFGELMNASHVSLRDDYEVTGIEMDTLVENSWKQEG